MASRAIPWALCAAVVFGGAVGYGQDAVDEVSVPAPSGLRCTTLPDGSVLLEWDNQGVYDVVNVDTGFWVDQRRPDRKRILLLPGDTTSWLDEVGGDDHNYIYGVSATVGEIHHSRWAECAAEDPREPIAFVRGDVNQDGRVSLADAVSLRRWMGLKDRPKLVCADAADINDDGDVDMIDVGSVSRYLFGIDNGWPHDGSATPAAPFPDAGFDTTHLGETVRNDCVSYELRPAETTDDILRMGQVESRPGEVVEVPIYLTNALPIEAVQLVVRYDPARIEVLSGKDQISFEDTFYSPFIAQYVFPTDNGHFTWLGPEVQHVRAFPDQGYFTLGIAGSIFNIGVFAIPPGEDTVIGRLRVRVSGDVPAGSILTLTPEDGPDGDGFGVYGLRNELTFDGDGRLATISPTKIEGVIAVGVDGDVSFFLRGDSNSDRRVDVADAIFTLGYLFLGGPSPLCADAADADDNGALELTDAVAILSALFLGQSALPAPYPERGRDVVPDFLPACRT